MKKKHRRRYRINWSALKPEFRQDRKSRRRRRIALIILAAAVLVAAIIRLPYTIALYRLKKLGYDTDTAKIIYEDRLDQRVAEYGYYSSYLAECFQNGTVNGDYLPLYLNVYNDRELTSDDFLLCQRLQDLGYETDQIQNLFANLSYEEILPLLVLSYQFNETSYIDDVVANRETNAANGTFELEGDYTDYYSDVYTITTITADVLINKNNLLASDCSPADLTTLDTTYAVDGVQMSAEAAEAFTEMAAAAGEEGIWFYATDGYDDYATQESSYSVNETLYGSDVADTYMPRAGASEHQSGLAVDVTMVNYESADFSTTDAYTWLTSHAAEYGFILRYPANAAIYTGYDAALNHLRYLGKELAQNVASSGLTYDVYYALYLKPWND